MDFHNRSKPQLEYLKMTDTQDINILLLGNTGADKATFINSVANYLYYESFEKALNAADLFVVIPSCMKIFDGGSKSVNIEFYCRKKLSPTSEAYGTQTVKSYFFPIGEGKTLGLIDTPGIGHPGKVEQDDINCEDILAYVGRLKNLYAICFLMKVDNTAGEAAFLEYCEKRILSRLTQSVRDNIIFIFTNARQTNCCTPSETLSYLTTTINGIKAKLPHVDMPLKNNIFAIDNEAFRFLVTRKSCINLDKWDQSKIDEIWKASTKECCRLISYIVGDDLCSGLPPYRLSDSNSINHVQSVIAQLSRPLVDIVELILYNIRILVEHKYILKMYQSLSLEKLKQALFIPSVELKVKELDHPAIVCTNVKCPQIIKVGNVKWLYSNKCVDPSRLTNVKEIIGDPNLQRYISISGSRECSKCSCDYLVHMPVYYTTNHVRITLKDGVVSDNIHTKQQALNASVKINTKIEQRKSKLEEELNFIIECMIKFALFLQHNAFLPFPDPYKNYVDHLRLRQRMDLPVPKSTPDLEKLMHEYERRKKDLENRLKLCSQFAVQTSESSLLTPKAICKSISSLYQLEHTGEKIQELLRKQKRSICWQYNDSCEHIDSALLDLNQAKGVKKKKVSTAFDEGNKKDQGKDRRSSEDKRKTSKMNQHNTSEFRKRRRRSELSDVSKQSRDQPSPYDDNASELEQKCFSKDKRKNSKTNQQNSSEFHKRQRFEFSNHSKECRDQQPPYDNKGRATQVESGEKFAPEPNSQEQNQCLLRGPELRYAPLPHHYPLSAPYYNPLHFPPLGQFPIHHVGPQQYLYQSLPQYSPQMPYQTYQQGLYEGVLQFFQEAALCQGLLQYSQQSPCHGSPQNCQKGLHQRPS